MRLNPRVSFLALAAMASTASFAGDRTIVLNPVNTSSWEFPTHTNAPRQRPQLGVGFWQRSSGAAPGVGSNYISAMEYQLPEAASARVRSASFQFSGRPAQCAGAEPVVIDVHAYVGNGKGEVADTQAGSRVAQLSADCSSNPAFARPIDVTQIVRQTSVASGVRHVGFNIRKGNNRQGPGIFNLAAGKLTVVLADEVLGKGALAPGARAAATPAPPLTKAERRREDLRQSRREYNPQTDR